MSIAGLASPTPFDSQRASAADGILQQLEDHRITDREIVERSAVLEVAPMEVSIIRRIFLRALPPVGRNEPSLLTPSLATRRIRSELRLRLPVHAMVA